MGCMDRGGSRATPRGPWCVCSAQSVQNSLTRRRAGWEGIGGRRYDTGHYPSDQIHGTSILGHFLGHACGMCVHPKHVLV